MNKLLISTATALGLVGAAVAMTSPANAQVGIEIGPGGPRARIYSDERPYRPVVERRVYRQSVDDTEECRVIVKRRVNEFGEMVTRRTRVCE